MILGIDVGGTFTDIVLVDGERGVNITDKVLSTPDDPSRGVIHGITKLRDVHGIDMGELTLFSHGSTVATNALLERETDPTVLLVNSGFADILEIGDQTRHNMSDLTIQKTAPIIPRDMVLEVEERVAFDGSVVEELADAEVERVCSQVAEIRPSACAITLLFSFNNPEHEKRLAAALQERMPEMSVAISSDVSPEIKEYQRAATTAASASLQPKVARYIAGVQVGLEEEAVGGSLFVMHSAGGVMSAEDASRDAHRMILSGPAAGVIASQRLAAAGYPNQITFDMGGTSTDICLIHEGSPRKSSETVINGIPIKTPQLDIHTIGSGGGSIARVDSGGLLHVGPQSAGADPGPAAYGRGGREATITDAHVVLGRIHPDSFLGGEMKLDLEAAKDAVRGKVADPLGLTLEEAAAGILEVADSVMARGIRVVSINRGFDPRDFSLVAFGGAGGLHALSAARLVDISTVVIPYAPGAYSAVGLVSADVRHELTKSLESPLSDLDAAALESAFRDLITSAEGMMEPVAELIDGVAFKRIARLRYIWQYNSIDVDLGETELDEERLAAAVSRFHELHDFEFGHSNPEDPVEVVSIVLEAIGRLPRPVWEEEAVVPEEPVESPAPRETRHAYFKETGWTDTPVYDRSSLRPGVEVAGPAVIEEREATVLVIPGATISVDGHANIVLSQGQES